MIKLCIFYAVLLSVLLGCSSTQPSHPKQNELVGTWQNTALKVTIKSYEGQADKDSILIVDRQNWEEVLKIKPIQTNYAADSTWQSKYFGLNGQLSSTTSGKWWLKGDTLWVHTSVPKDELIFYICSINRDKASFKTTIDWDSDGMADDVYDGEQERVR